MRRSILSAAAVMALAVPALALPTLGWAQDDHHGGEHHGGGGAAPHAAPAPQVRPAPAFQPHGPAFPGGQGGYRPQAGQPNYRAQRPTFPGGQGGYRPQPGQPNYRPQGQNFPGGQGGYRPQPGQPGYRGQGSNFSGAQGGYRGEYRGEYRGGERGFQPGGPRRAGGQAFNYGGRNFYRFHASPYRYPRGYDGRRWRRGEWLPPIFISEAYFINDWYDFGFTQPYPGYEWIRVGDDALLVNLETGQIVDEVPGVYYDE